MANVVTVLQEHFDLNPATIAEHYQFYRRDQPPGKSVPDYAVELCCLSANCEFEGHLNDVSRDRSVCGL